MGSEMTDRNRTLPLFSLRVMLFLIVDIYPLLRVRRDRLLGDILSLYAEHWFHLGRIARQEIFQIQASMEEDLPGKVFHSKQVDWSIAFAVRRRIVLVSRLRCFGGKVDVVVENRLLMSSQFPLYGLDCKNAPLVVGGVAVEVESHIVDSWMVEIAVSGKMTVPAVEVRMPAVVVLRMV